MQSIYNIRWSKMYNGDTVKLGKGKIEVHCYKALMCEVP